MLQFHKEKITGIIMDKDQGQFYSIGNDKKLRVTSLAHQKSTAEFAIGNHPLVCIGHDTKFKRLIAMNEIGVFYIFSISSKLPIFIIQLSLENSKIIRSLSIDSNQGYYFTCNIILSLGSTNGNITIVHFPIPGKEKLTKQLGQFKGPENPNCIVWHKPLAELLVAYDSGNIVIWQTHLAAISCSITVYIRCVQCP